MLHGRICQLDLVVFLDSIALDIVTCVEDQEVFLPDRIEVILGLCTCLFISKGYLKLLVFNLDQRALSSVDFGVY